MGLHRDRSWNHGCLYSVHLGQKRVHSVDDRTGLSNMNQIILFELSFPISIFAILVVRENDYDNHCLSNSVVPRIGFLLDMTVF